MSSKIFTDLPMSDVTSSVASAKSHFDTFETKFFEQGEVDSARLAVEVERFDDLDGGKAKRFLSRQFVVSAAIASACVAVVAGIVLWRSGGQAAPTESAVAQIPSTVPAPVAAPVPQALPPAAVAEPVAPAQALPSSGSDDKAIAPAVAIAAAEPPTSEKAAPAAVVANPAAPRVEANAAAIAAEAAKPVLADAKLGLAEAKAAPAVDGSEVRERCKKAIQSKRNKDVLAACPDAFAADPAAADIAVALARIEFDRGRVAQSSTWSKKALAADPNAADAYVFIGGAEQSAGHDKAAKEAYKHYLQLAPGGRYAGDLRAIVGSL